MINGKKIGLVLSGGGAKGFAHIGVVKVLEQNGIVPDIVVGTSMGSTMGGLYASGMSVDELEKKALDFKVTNIFDLNMFNITRQGIIAGKKFIKFIDENTNNALIENFPIKYGAVACDIVTGKEYVFESGKFSVATRTSSSIPGLFAPLKKDGMILIDGGVINNIPTDVAYQMGADYVISVDCIGKGYLIKNVKNIMEILMSSFSITQYHLNKERGYRADTKIVIDNYSNDVFDAKREKILENINLGEKMAMEKIDKIKKDLNIA